MTAKLIVEEHLQLLYDQLEVPGICVDCVKKQIEELEKVLKALNELEKLKEKDTPTDVELSSDGYADGYPVYDYSCPNCGYEIKDYEEYEEYCHQCGQHLSWDKILDDKLPF